MKKIATFAVVAALAGLATLTTARQEPVYTHRAQTVVEDPDPADCPFCGGNPGLHIRRMLEVQQLSMRLLAETWL